MKTTDSGFFLPWVSWLAQLPYITQMTPSIVGWALLHPLAIKKMHKTWPQINHIEAIPHRVSFFWVCQVDKIKSHTRIFTASVLSEAHQVWDPGSLPKLFFYFYWSICLWLCLFSLQPSMPWDCTSRKHFVSKFLANICLVMPHCWLENTLQDGCQHPSLSLLPCKEEAFWCIVLYPLSFCLPLGSKSIRNRCMCVRDICRLVQ